MSDILIPTEQELTDKAISDFYKAFNKSLLNEKSPVGDFLFKEFKSGKKEVYNKSIRETKVFDDTFIDTLRNAFPSFMKIMKEPKKTLKYESEVIQMEKAKKVSSESIRHLASHTQFIKEVKNDGQVLPSKILSTFADDDYAIYENRFIKTLVNKIIKFLEIRFNLMNENLESYQADRVIYKNSIKRDGKIIDVSIEAQLKQDLEEETSTAKKVLYDVQALLDLYRSLKGTQLYQKLIKAKDVASPIMKTNIIMHNPEFKVAYNTWVYLDRANRIGYNVDIKERRHTDTLEVTKDFDMIAASIAGEMLYHRGSDGYSFKKSSEYIRTTNKKPKDLNVENEYVFTPKNITLEHQEVSEYLLTETAKYYNDSLKRSLKQGLSFEMSAKKVYRELLDVVNLMTPEIFDDDIDADLDLEEQLEKSKRDVEIMSLILEQKQIDYNKSIKKLEALKRQTIKIEKALKEAKDEA